MMHHIIISVCVLLAAPRFASPPCTDSAGGWLSRYSYVTYTCTEATRYKLVIADPNSISPLAAPQPP